MKYVYMNHRIREKDPSGPVISIQVGKRLHYTNCAEIVLDGVRIWEVRFLKRGLKAAPHHKVRAFVEFEDGVEVRPV